jgi:NAD+ synthase (glutamine-hydrolysing)
VRLGLAQLNTRVGAVEENTTGALAAIREARDALGCELVLLPELTLSGYPPEDLLFHGGLRSRVELGFARMLRETQGIAAYFGYPEYEGTAIFNAGALIRDGELVANHRKMTLPNYAVFDEKRYFEAGNAPTVAELGGIRFGLIICEDVWTAEPAREAVARGAEVILIINGSPYHIERQRRAVNLS